MKKTIVVIPGLFFVLNSCSDFQKSHIVQITNQSAKSFDSIVIKSMCTHFRIENINPGAKLSKLYALTSASKCTSDDEFISLFYVGGSIVFYSSAGYHANSSDVPDTIFFKVTPNLKVIGSEGRH